jgi:hypothetical protein
VRAYMVMKALDVAIEGLPVYQDVPAGTSKQIVPYSQRRADALGRVAESFLPHDVLESPGTDRQQIVVHVAAEDVPAGVLSSHVTAARVLRNIRR